MSSKVKIKEALVAITYRCNARCHMCNTWQHPTHPKEELTPSNLETLPKLEFCNITGGEPFIREDIEGFVKLLSKKSKRIVISTNGFFTEKIVALAKKYPSIGIRISIEGLPATNDELRGIKDGYDHGMRTLLELHQLGLKDIGFGITLSDKNIMDLMELYQLSKAMNLEFATASMHNTFYFHKFDNRITRHSDFDRQLKRLITDLLQSRRVKNWFRGYFNYGLLSFIHGNKRLLPCSAGENLIFIDPLANIMPCNGMEERLGNLREQSFERIWNSPQAEMVRQKVRNCKKECWMIGSAAPAMKKNILKPGIWVLKNKLRLSMGRELDLKL